MKVKVCVAVLVCALLASLEACAVAPGPHSALNLTRISLEKHDAPGGGSSWEAGWDDAGIQIGYSLPGKKAPRRSRNRISMFLKDFNCGNGYVLNYDMKKKTIGGYKMKNIVSGKKSTRIPMPPVTFDDATMRGPSGDIPQHAACWDDLAIQLSYMPKENGVVGIVLLDARDRKAYFFDIDTRGRTAEGFYYEDARKMLSDFNG